MSWKSNDDTYTFWVDLVSSLNVSAFVREGGLDGSFLDVGTSSNWGVLIVDEDKRVCSEYPKWAIPFY